LGRLDILVNNAGVAVTGPLDSGEDFARQHAINVGGVVTAIRAAAGVMGAGGRIVTIGSVIGERAGFPGMADYAATKAAVVGYTKGAARDFGPKGRRSGGRRVPREPERVVRDGHDARRGRRLQRVAAVALSAPTARPRRPASRCA
jgi:NAD(P)-dependent dehydrogenase (short-subunit alcohol dehydrogenase family)